MNAEVEGLRASLNNEKHLLRNQTGEANKCVTRQRIMEIERRLHVLSEGNGVANDHPDGCFECGSPHHHTGDCREVL